MLLGGGGIGREAVLGERRYWEGGGGIGREAVYDIPDPETPVLRLVCSPGRSVL